MIAERERIGRDLHDVVLQRLYGMGLGVQAIAGVSDAATAARLDETVNEIDRVIAEVRTIVFTLGSAWQPGSLGQEITDVVAQATRWHRHARSVRTEPGRAGVVLERLPCAAIDRPGEAADVLGDPEPATGHLGRDDADELGFR